MPTSTSRQRTFESHQGGQFSSFVAVYHQPSSFVNPSTTLSLARLRSLPESLAELVVNAHTLECNIVEPYRDLLRERNIKCLIVRGHIIRRCCALAQVSRVTIDLATYGFGAVLRRLCCHNPSHLFPNPHPALQLAIWALSWACFHKKLCGL